MMTLSDAKSDGLVYNEPLSPEEVEDIIRMKQDEDMSLGEIVIATGKSRSTIVRYLTKNGVSFRVPRLKTKPLDEGQWKDIQKQKLRGVISTIVAESMGVNLRDINLAYAAPTYAYYIDHR